jgi:hypothetical protein
MLGLKAEEAEYQRVGCQNRFTSDIIIITSAWPLEDGRGRKKAVLACPTSVALRISVLEQVCIECKPSFFCFAQTPSSRHGDFLKRQVYGGGQVLVTGFPTFCTLAKPRRSMRAAANLVQNIYSRQQLLLSTCLGWIAAALAAQACLP